VPIGQFSVEFSLFKADICFGETQNTIILLQNLLESLFWRNLKIPLLPDLCKEFFSVYQSHLCAEAACEPVIRGLFRAKIRHVSLAEASI